MSKLNDSATVGKPLSYSIELKTVVKQLNIFFEKIFENFLKKNLKIFWKKNWKKIEKKIENIC